MCLAYFSICAVVKQHHRRYTWIRHTLCSRVLMYDRMTNLTRSISVCTSIMRKCSSSEESGSARNNSTSFD